MYESNKMLSPRSMKPPPSALDEVPLVTRMLSVEGDLVEWVMGSGNGSMQPPENPREFRDSPSCAFPSIITSQVGSSPANRVSSPLGLTLRDPPSSSFLNFMACLSPIQCMETDSPVNTLTGGRSSIEPLKRRALKRSWSDRSIGDMPCAAACGGSQLLSGPIDSPAPFTLESVPQLQRQKTNEPMILSPVMQLAHPRVQPQQPQQQPPVTTHGASPVLPPQTYAVTATGNTTQQQPGGAAPIIKSEPVKPEPVVDSSKDREPDLNRTFRPCKCRKSKCLKLYCECFSGGKFCSEGEHCTMICCKALTICAQRVRVSTVGTRELIQRRQTGQEIPDPAKINNRYLACPLNSCISEHAAVCRGWLHANVRGPDVRKSTASAIIVKQRVQIDVNAMGAKIVKRTGVFKALNVICVSTKALFESAVFCR